MPQVPTNQMERELRKLYLRWLSGVPAHSNDLTGYIAQFQAQSTALIAKLGGKAAAQGTFWGATDFPTPKLLELSPYVGKVYDQMQQAAISSGIAAGLGSKDVARQMLNAGLGKGYKRLERLARTETVSAYWKNGWDSIADLPDIVMLWGSEESKRTCDYCLSRDGLVIEDGNIRDHPNGRCTPIPTHRSQVKYKGTLQPDGSVFMDPRWTGKRASTKAPTTATREQLDPLSTKTNPAAPSVAQPAQQSARVNPEGKDFTKMTPAEKLKSVEIMYGTGSPQHLKAAKLFSKPTTTKTVPPTTPRVIKTTKDMEQFGAGMPVPSTLGPKAAKVMDDYAKGTAYTANAVLRGQKTYLGRPIDARTKTYTKGFTKDMDKMMDSSIIPEDVRVVRAVQADAFGGLDKLQDLAGGIYQDKGYMSTSLAEKVSSKVYDVKDAIEMEIDVPKGTRAMYMAGESYLKSERELLLDRGTNLAIKSVTYDERSKKWKVKATVVPGPR